MNKQIDGIKLCDVLHRNIQGKQELVVHLILEDNLENTNHYDFFKKIQDIVYKETHNLNMVPNVFKVRNEFPYAKSGKRDIGKMMNENEGFEELKYDVVVNKHLLKRK